MVSWALHLSQPPNGISIGSAVFAGHIRVTSAQTCTDRQTDRQTTLRVPSVSIGRNTVMRAMRPKSMHIFFFSPSFYVVILQQFIHSFIYSFIYLFIKQFLKNMIADNT